jgi:cyclophilin family peptidyl-prolyl cis-trans isomerase
MGRGSANSLLCAAVGTTADKHARQRQNRARLDTARKDVAKTQRRKRVVTIVAALGAVAVLVGGVLAFTISGDDSDQAGSTSTTAGTGSSTTVEAGAAKLATPDPGLTLKDPTPCPPAAGSAKRVQAFAGPPPTCIDPTATYTATFSTSKGDFTAKLDAEKAPITVNNFVVLARYHAYDSVPFHRIIPGFVIQGGDLDGDPWGNNDLGYQLQDELPASAGEYKDYTLVMANSGPNTNGSQFFVTLPGGGAQLQPLYSLFGEVTEGQDVVDAIGALGTATQEPSRAVVINTITINETKG